MSEIEIREAALSLDAVEERTITGLAVPYNQEASIGGGIQERFAPGAIDSVEDVKLFYGHEEPIGKVISGRETDAGYEITAKVSQTSRGDEILTLMRDGVLNKFSVGFMPIEHDRDGSLITRTLIDLKEVSVVPFPAFAGANITEVREDQQDVEALETQTEERDLMSENIELEVRSVQDEVAELRRVVEAGLTIETPKVIGSEIRSQGEFAKKLLDGDAEAIELARTASTTANTVTTAAFVGQINNLINDNRPALSAFSRAALPGSGLSVEYASVTANTLSVTAQAAENDALAFGNLTIANTSAAVATYGGYTTFSKQTIERSTVDYLNTVFQALTIAYANASNTAFINHLQALEMAGAGKVFDVSAGTVAALIEGITDGASYIFTNTGLRPEFIVCGTNVYKKLMTIVGTDGRPVVLQVGDGNNNVGTADLPGLVGNLLGLPLIVDPGMNADRGYMANGRAIQSFESPGAPVRLTDGDITTLTDSVSVYGYMAITTPFAGAVVAIQAT